MNHILTQKDLLELAGVGQKARLIRWLNASGIKYRFNAKKEVFTTIEQLNASFDEGEGDIVFGHGQKS